LRRVGDLALALRPHIDSTLALMMRPGGLQRELGLVAFLDSCSSFWWNSATIWLLLLDELIAGVIGNAVVNDPGRSWTLVG